MPVVPAPIPDVAYIRMRNPEFSVAVIPNDMLQLLIDEAKREINESAWGALYGDGILYLTLHLATLWIRARNLAGGPAGASAGGPPLMGALKWEQVGNTQRGYAEVKTASGGAGISAWLQSTMYGSRYAELAEKVFADRTGLGDGYAGYIGFPGYYGGGWFW